MIDKTSSQSVTSKISDILPFYAALRRFLIFLTSKMTDFDVAKIWNKCSD
jgi:hypothetical protein